MVSVEVYECGESADEAAAVRALQEAKGLDEHEASGPFGLLYRHRRPFTVRFAMVEEADRFIERLRACGYRSRLEGAGGGAA